MKNRQGRKKRRGTYKSRQMINRNDGTPLPDALGVHLDGRFGEGRIDAVDGNRVVGVGGAVVSARAPLSHIFRDI